MEENKKEIVINIESETQDSFYAVYAGLKLFKKHKDYVRKMRGNGDKVFVSQLEANVILSTLKDDHPDLFSKAEEWFLKEPSSFGEREEKTYTVEEIREYLQSQNSLGDCLYNLKNLK